MPAQTPEELDRLFAAALNAGDLEALLALYEPGAALEPQPGRVVSGGEALRAALVGFLALKPTITMDTGSAIVAGELALTSSRWVLTGTGPDGAPVELRGTSAEVARRQPDGSWRFVIDRPFSGA